MPKINVYTDGSSIGNPGPAGVGVVIYGKQTKQIALGFKHATNNQMELLACCVALKHCTKHMLTIHTDSQYTIDSVTKWCSGWIKNNWKTLGRNPVKNRELITCLYDAWCSGSIEFVKVKAHSGVEGNELADVLAKQGAAKPTRDFDAYAKKLLNSLTSN